MNPNTTHNTTGAHTTGNPLTGHHNTAGAHTTGNPLTGNHNATGTHTTGNPLTGTHDHTHGTPAGHAHTGAPGTAPKPSMADKIGGKVEAAIGKATHNPAKVQEGEIKQTVGKAGLEQAGVAGHGVAPGAHGAHGAHGTTGTL